MGKIRTRTLGVEDVEQEQKEEQKKKSQEKKQKKLSKATETLKAAEEKEHKELEAEGKEPKAKTKKAEKATAKEVATKVEKHVRGKKYKGAKSKIENRIYDLSEAVPLLKKLAYTKFDESVELHLNVDEQGLKGEIELPHSTGKTVRVAVVDDAILEKIDKGVIEFDVLVAHPSYMPKLAKYARVLGPKGLMPNPKAGTVSPNPEEVVKKFSKGVLRWKTEPKFPLVHQMIGKVSFEPQQIQENAQSFLAAVGKGHIKEAYIKTTMSPSLRIDIERI